MKTSRNACSQGFLGIGRMAEVILRALLDKKILNSSQVRVSRQNPRELQRISRQLKVKTTTDNRELVRLSQVIWLGVKPYQAKEVLRQIAPHLSHDTIIISMMAGISTRFIQKTLGQRLPIIRLMPNTPAAVGSGLTGVYFNPATSPNIKKWLIQALQSIGQTALCANEKDLDAITGLSGSGVAFVYEFCRAMIQGGKKSGLSEKVAMAIAGQTLLGAAKMLQNSGREPSALIAQVVSKGGTTEAGLKTLKKHHADQAIAAAVVAATQRAKALRKENER